jgi:hypothetical protein
MPRARLGDGGFASRERMKDEPYYDAPLAARVSRLLGPGFQSALAPRRKRFLKTDFPLNVQGMYVSPGAESRVRAYPYTEDRGEPVHDLLRPEQDMVYVFGERPDATTFAHEFRHRAGIKSESRNRLFDALYAETTEDWQEAVRMWRDQLQRERTTREISPTEAESDLIRTLKRSDTSLRREEWDAAPTGEKPKNSDPTVLGWLSQALGPREAYALRAPASYERFEKKARGGLAVLLPR